MVLNAGFNRDEESHVFDRNDASKACNQYMTLSAAHGARQADQSVPTFRTSWRAGLSDTGLLNINGLDATNASNSAAMLPMILSLLRRRPEHSSLTLQKHPDISTPALSLNNNPSRCSVPRFRREQDTFFVALNSVIFKVAIITVEQWPFRGSGRALAPHFYRTVCLSLNDKRRG